MGEDVSKGNFKLSKENLKIGVRQKKFRWYLGWQIKNIKLEIT